MALNHCYNCTTSYALGLDACPHCRQPTTTTITDPSRTVAEGDQAVRDAVRQSARRAARKEPPAETEPPAGSDA